MIQLHVTLKGRSIITRESPGHRALIGRAATNDVVLEGAGVEPIHCVLERRPEGTWHLALLGSTRVNGEVFDVDVAVKEGDVLGVGAFELTFRWIEPAPVVEAPTWPRRIGRYEVTGELGKGGMGLVLRARDPRLRRDVAIKVLKTGRVASEHARRRFEREANVLARLSHPNILNVFDVGDHEGMPYLVMELIEGESLEARLLRDGPLPYEAALRISEEVVRALHYAHTQGVLHRDVKPGNLLLRAPRDQALLMDFGLAKDLAREAQSGLTAPGATLGTLGFFPPEQLDNAANVSAQADVFAAGATLYASLTGRPPFFKAIKTSRSIIMAIMNEQWTPILEVCPALPPAVEAVITSCLRAKPAERYEDALALAEDLARLRRGEAPLAAAPKARTGVVAAMDALMSAALDDDRTPPAAPRPAAPLALPSPTAPTARVPREPSPPTLSRETLRVASAPSSADGEAEADALVERARERFVDGDAIGAIDALDRALELAPARADIWSMRAVARRRRGDDRGALSDQDEALRLDPDDIGARVGRGLIRSRARDHLRAAEDFEHALECLPEGSPRRPRVEAMLERALGALGDTVVRGFRLRRPSGMGEVERPKPGDAPPR